jgi:hypothetical protein
MAGYCSRMGERSTAGDRGADCGRLEKKDLHLPKDLGATSPQPKNIQVVDRADNCTYSVFAASDEEFEAIFPHGTDIEFVEDLFARIGDERATQITAGLWKRPVKKAVVQGIHGTLFYQLIQKKQYYPTKKESEMVPLGCDPSQRDP